jgi:predicted flap endonuclease-1-like 5' DNA nuclease
MKTFKVFLFGLLYGLFLKFAFDRIYRSNELEDLRNENASLMEYIRTLESKFQSRSVKPSLVSSPPEPVQPKAEKDDLKEIKGIGPAIEKKLHNAGILTFESLAGLSTAELEHILGSTRRLVQEGNLISQAKKLAKQNHR